MRSAEEVRADLQLQLTSRVRWTESVRAMLAAGADTFVELGPGTVLSGLLRRIAPDAAALSLDAADSLQALAAEAGRAGRRRCPPCAPSSSPSSSFWRSSSSSAG
jgi:[acyl-carrier-protein] S-malonyltransferase